MGKHCWGKLDPLAVIPLLTLTFNPCSGGRDKVVHVWDMETGGTLKTIPVFEVSWNFATAIV